MDFQTVALHELGHVLGLQHHGKDQKNVDSIMNTEQQRRDPAFASRFLYPDDRAAVRSLYPVAPDSGPDLVAEDVSFVASGGGRMPTKPSRIRSTGLRSRRRICRRWYS